MSDLDKCIDSKTYNNTGMHIEKTSCKVTSSGANVRLHLHLLRLGRLLTVVLTSTR